MPISSNKVAMRRREFTWEYEGDECRIVYNANGITSRGLQEMRELPGEEGDTALLTTLSRVIIEWEVLMDDGQPWPTVVDWPEDASEEDKAKPTLRDLPLSFCDDCLTAMGQDATNRTGG